MKFVSRPASDKIRQNMIACVMEGALANFVEARGCVNAVGQSIAARGFD
ncbi:MAG TPA: hypothetical protein VL442_19080 [Mucilaginibacter sp.]|jgi:hypothetical protein|nr:hypothetical protein [Mucilaginibacter sp.]